MSSRETDLEKIRSLRAQAEKARRLSAQITPTHAAASELGQFATDREADADRLEAHLRSDDTAGGES